MAFTWTKGWTSADDGSVLGGADLKNIQDNLDAQAMQLANTQTATGDKTFSGTCTFSGGNTHSGANTFSNTNTFTGAVSFTNKSVITCLSTTASVDMKTVAKTTLYTVPATKSCIITHIVVRGPSASLAGGTSYGFGSGATATTWRQAVDLQTMTASTDYMVITSSTAVPVKYTIQVAADVIGIYVTTGSTLAATATIDLWGYLF